MAYRALGESAQQANPGDLLQVIHDFEARDPDELSLRRGDKIELIEKDDNFGDGWYLGRHVGDGRSGLFPEVYTKLAIPQTSTLPLSDKGRRSYRSNSTPSSQNPPQPSQEQRSASAMGTASKDYPTGSDGADRPYTEAPLATSSFQVKSSPYEAAPSPLKPSNSQRTVSAPSSGFQVPNASGSNGPRSVSLDMKGGRVNELTSPVINETLSVIDEHITDLNTPRSSILVSEPRMVNDSGSEYSARLDHRMSYINGNETDEEEKIAYSQAEVNRWTAKQVASCLADLGIERGHCEVFREQEITGEVLLTLDKDTLFMKEFDLGPVGRRLRTWHKIKTFQDEVRSNGRSSAKAGRGSSSVQRMPSSESIPRSLSQASTASTSHRYNYGRHPAHASPVHDTHPALGRDSLPIQQPGTPGRSRAASSTQVNNGGSSRMDDSDAHKKKPSLDRNWTMGSASTSPSSHRVSAFLGLSSLNMVGHSVSPKMFDFESTSTETHDIDRGYLSSGEVESRRFRKVLRKRDSGSPSHSRHSSYQNSGNANKRHSRFGSAGSLSKAIASVASGTRERPKSQAEKDPSRLAVGDISAPVVTKLDYTDSPTSTKVATDSIISNENSVAMEGSSQASITQSTTSVGKTSSLTTAPSPIKQGFQSESVLQSPTKTVSTTGSRTSKGSEPENKAAAAAAAAQPASAARRAKTKRDTSAYQKGLMRITPQDAMKDCDYSGWMKKRSPRIIATWKPRLFVLRGRRLSYYYSERDKEEQGLIDISNHKVLPADDLFTGLHATVTGAKSSPTSPLGSQTETKNQTEVKASIDGTISDGGEDGMFIFKLVPPRPGAPRAVNFTKPAVHYFAVDNIKQGRLWMAALMKATIEKDDTKPVKSTYQQKTISLAKAKQMRQRPPALMNLEEDVEAKGEEKKDGAGLNIKGLEDGISPKSLTAKEAEEKPSVDAKLEAKEPAASAGDASLTVEKSPNSPKGKESTSTSLRVVKSVDEQANGATPAEKPPADKVGEQVPVS